MNLKNCTTALFVKDAELSKKFYTELLGLTVTMDFGGTNITFKEGFTIWQINPGNIISKTLGNENITNPENITRFELYFETDDLDGIYKTLKTNGVKSLHEMHTEVWGQCTIRFYDPDGHLIEIGEAMSIFLKRIYEEENRDLVATSKRTSVSGETLRQFLGE